MPKTKTEPPGKLGGAPGACMSPRVTRDYSSAKIKNPSLPLKIRREDLEALQPLEKAYALHLIETRPGEVFVLVDQEG